MRTLAADGFTAIINLAPVNPPYTPADEAGLVQSLGMATTTSPSSGTTRPTPISPPSGGDANPDRDTALIHCAANFPRDGLLLTLCPQAFWAGQKNRGGVPGADLGEVIIRYGRSLLRGNNPATTY